MKVSKRPHGVYVSHNLEFELYAAAYIVSINLNYV